MLHIRYDWRRPVFWASICLTFFLSSQTSSNGNNIADSTQLAKAKAGAGMIEINEAEKGDYESNFPVYFSIAKR